MSIICNERAERVARMFLRSCWNSSIVVGGMSNENLLYPLPFPFPL
jgi:hypothetical protein